MTLGRDLWRRPLLRAMKDTQYVHFLMQFVDGDEGKRSEYELTRPMDLLEGAFADELALLQPTPGYMRVVKDRILHVWEQRRAEAKNRTAEQQRRVSTIQQKLDKLDEAFLFAQTIDATSYERQRDRLREELTFAQIDHHTEAVDELDVQGILAFAERILPRASDLWVQASLDYRQRLQQLFFPEGIAFDGNRFNRTAVTAPLFRYLTPSESADEKMARVVHLRAMRYGGQPSRGLPTEAHVYGKRERRVVSLNFASWNQLDGWLRQVEGLRHVA